MRAIDADALKEKIMGVNSFDKLLPAERYIVDKIDHMPTIQSEQRTGKWLINCDGYYPYCSECRIEPKSGVMTDFCPNCGAKMEGDAE